ncbi:hypothetical protein BCAR13_370067 [Paraburkholderia caribensis]|nr:hypothetical protein BCAR13_370067 [Paraburkholderia caribensis]
MRRHDGRNALADALELVGRRIQHRERLPQQRFARAAEDRGELVVAVFDDPFARQHETDRREMKSGLVIQSGHEISEGCGTSTYVFLRIVPQGRRIVPFRHITRCAAGVPEQFSIKFCTSHATVRRR